MPRRTSFPVRTPGRSEKKRPASCFSLSLLNENAPLEPGRVRLASLRPDAKLVLANVAAFIDFELLRFCTYLLTKLAYRQLLITAEIHLSVSGAGPSWPPVSIWARSSRS